MTLRYVELFAGMGGLSLGLDRAGMECVAHVEFNPFGRRVLAARWPNVPLLADVRLTHGGWLVREYGPIRVLSGGSPCQDLSVAGTRAGIMDGSRSVLFFEQVRIWREILAAQAEDCLFLWENVDGARSSNDGKDFGAVLSAIVGGTVFVPSDGWRSAGVAAGPAGIAAWRLLDAQFFGVPQRRRRIFVVGTHRGSVDPAAVLFDEKGVSRNPKTRRVAREKPAPVAVPSPEGQGGFFD